MQLLLVELADFEVVESKASRMALLRAGLTRPAFVDFVRYTNAGLGTHMVRLSH